MVQYLMVSGLEGISYNKRVDKLGLFSLEFEVEGRPDRCIQNYERQR